MRLRHIPGADEEINKSPFVVQDANKQKNNWNNFFNNDHPIEIEIGMGKGKFIMELAQRNPNINYIGIEIYSSVLLKALQKVKDLTLPNLYFLCVDARNLADIFAPAEVQKIYLNFSDPWPKDRHAKRRLTSPEFMSIYHLILNHDGCIEFKTDNIDLFEYSLGSIPHSGWKIRAHTFDLHHSDMAEMNVLTEYEAKFSAAGKPICKLIAFR